MTHARYPPLFPSLASCRPLLPMPREDHFVPIGVLPPCPTTHPTCAPGVAHALPLPYSSRCSLWLMRPPTHPLRLLSVFPRPPSTCSYSQRRYLSLTSRQDASSRRPVALGLAAVSVVLRPTALVFWALLGLRELRRLAPRARLTLIFAEVLPIGYCTSQL